MEAKRRSLGEPVRSGLTARAASVAERLADERILLSLRSNGQYYADAQGMNMPVSMYSLASVVM